MKDHSPLKKSIPNIITLFRLVLSPALLLFAPFSVSFLLLYALLGLSDVLDGFLARRWGVSCKLGARLDSAADFLLFGILLYLLVRNYRFPAWALLWVGLIAILRFVALAVCYVRFHKLAFLHVRKQSNGAPPYSVSFSSSPSGAQRFRHYRLYRG